MRLDATFTLWLLAPTLIAETPLVGAIASCLCSGERHTVFLKFSPQADAYRTTHAERAKQYEGVALRDVATLDINRWERICKMLSLVHSESARL